MTSRQSNGAARAGPLESHRSDHLSDLLARASHLMAARVNAQVKWHGIGVSEWRVLAALTRRDGIAMSELADRVLFKQPTLTKAVDRMERAGLVERRTSERDRRRTIVRVTERGRTLAAPLIVRARESEAAMLAELGTAALGDLADRLRALIERLSAKPGRNRAIRRPRSPRESETRFSKRALPAAGN